MKYNNNSLADSIFVLYAKAMNQKYPLEVLFHDEHIIAISKHPREIVQSDKSTEKPLCDIVLEYLNRHSKKSYVFLGIPHRLDRPVSGVLIFAKTKHVLRVLNAMLEKRQVKKVYWAVVKNKPADQNGKLVHYLKKDQRQNKSSAFSMEEKNTKKAELSYRVLKSSDNYHLLELRPVTGRHHQLRAQLGAIGCPIKGDIKYGFDRTNNDGSIHLHARTVILQHPVKKGRLVITAPLPDETLWNFFSGGTTGNNQNKK